MAGEMHIKVLLFADLKEAVGAGQLSLDFDRAISVSELKHNLVSTYPDLEGRLETVLVSINQEYSAGDDPIPDGAEVALFPPVSGGAEGPTIYKITNDALDLDDLVDQITLTSSGAACIFSGMVRGETTRKDPHQTVALDYEAYVPMAEAKMRQVAEEIRERWPAVQGIAIVQRIGHLLPRTPTVLIACTAAHRDTGVFEAARYGIDRLKEIVPIWKKEIGPNGEEWVEGGYTPHKGE